MIRFETSHGGFTVELYAEDAPETVANFLRYVDEGFFDGTVFHRIVPGFVIQGGGLTSDFEQKKTHPPVRNEAANGVRNQRGTLSMARTDAILRQSRRQRVSRSASGTARLCGIRPRDRGHGRDRPYRGAADRAPQRLYRRAAAGRSDQLGAPVGSHEVAPDRPP